jgi:hypothetical protein
MAEFITQAAFARLRGVSKATVNGWKKRGYIQFGPDGKLVDVAATEKVLGDRPAVYRGGKLKAARPSPAQLASAPDWSLAESTRRRQAAMAALAELELATKSGKLLERDKAFACWAGIMKGVQGRMLAWPSKAAFICPTLTATDRSALDQMTRDDLQDASLNRGFDVFDGGKIADESENDQKS